ncbi:GNAT family N-acetyltransferase [Allorhizocola rhizosphaerae]|uniref:GNAT family N-acetyltransferase n=1 Tax=Allorhizocola rhizosphaerae TaxID=1872709 RepID=UPI000E3E825E|nr:GNAT family N-acetyltransferase [Allorhizocola rhizosphaerae]
MTKLRPETAADHLQAAEVHALAWRRAYAGILPGSALDALDPAEMAERRAGRAGDSLVAEQDGRVVGFVNYGSYRGDESIGEIYAIYVHPDFWGTGIADALFTAALDALPQAEVRLWVLAENQRAQRFYARHGLSRDGETGTFRPRGTELGFPIARWTLVRGRQA